MALFSSPGVLAVTFRADIAGLRALAVVPIVLFHAGVGALPGGFVGVDIFFVISGFLITGLIRRDLQQGHFRLAQFYRRRVVRILPALAVMLCATLMAGTLILLPQEQADLGHSAAAAAGFVSNLYFHQTTGYFAASAEATPLLHTWSLAVEEQFYILYPALLLAVWRWRPAAVAPVILGAVLASFLLALGLGAQHPTAAFYLLPSRAWELGLGALVALGLVPRIPSATGRNLAALLGLGLILAALLWVHPGRLFPAPLALLPVFGAALLIAYGQGAVTERLLAARPMCWIGAISFSLYLWHWPIIVFYRLHSGADLTPLETAGLVAVSILCAGLSTLLVERPMLARFRDAGRGTDRRVLLAGGAGLAALAGLALTLPQIATSLRPLPPQVAQVAAFLHYRDTDAYRQQFRRGECFFGGTEEGAGNPACLRLAADRPNIVVMGDSHAAQLWRALAERYEGRPGEDRTATGDPTGTSVIRVGSFAPRDAFAPGRAQVLQATASGCRPLRGGAGREGCTALMRRVFDEMVPSGQVDAVILAGRWQAAEMGLLRETVLWLRAQGIATAVIGPTVEYDGDFPALLARAMLSGHPETVAQLRRVERQQLEAGIGRALEGSGAVWVPLHPLICPRDVCRQRSASGAPYQFDYGHLTLDAARELVARMAPLDAMMARVMR